MTTTSVQDSGLLDELLPVFEKRNNVKVKVIAVGTGEALRLAKDGNGDVVLAHAPRLEKAFVDSGFGLSRTPIMRNDFVIVGPKDDPAGVKEETSTLAVFEKIAKKPCPFVSRGDRSGTHTKEKEIWALLGISGKPQGTWYIESGSGMGTTLRIANEKRGYTLTDRATYVVHRAELDLEILAGGDSLLANKYSLIPVPKERRPEANLEMTKRFIAFLTGEEGQRLITNYGRGKFNEALFLPIDEDSSH